MTSWIMILTRNVIANILSEDAGCRMRGGRDFCMMTCPCPRIPHPFVLLLKIEPLI